MLPPPPPDASAPPAGSSMTSNLDKMYAARALTWFCALITFAVTSSIENYNLFDALKFTIAIGVILWVYLTVLLANYVGANYAHHEIMPVDMVESKVRA